MEDLGALLDKRKEGKEYKKLDKENGIIKKKLVPDGFILMKIPENLDDLTIGKLRTLHADIFGKEPTHDRVHTKVWIANKIKAILNK